MRKGLLLVFIFISCTLCGVRVSFAQGTWTNKADFGGTKRQDAFSFSIGNKGYVGTGFDGQATKDFWEYNPSNNTWTQKADYAGGPTIAGIGLSISYKGYAGLGTGNNHFYEYNPLTNAWTIKTSYPGSSWEFPVSFTIGNFGYICTGIPVSNELWQYDPSIDVWTQKSSLPGAARGEAIAFSIGTKGYVGSGYNAGILNDFWEYNSSTDSWTQKANTPGSPRCDATGFSICNKGYIALGEGPVAFFRNDLWEYDTLTDSWTQKATLGAQLDETISFTINGKAYVGTGGMTVAHLYKVFYEYTPDSVCSHCAPAANFISSDTTFCGESAHCISFTDLSYCNVISRQWHFPGAMPDTSTQQNPTNICYSTPGTYPVTLIVTNSAGTDTLTVSPMIIVGGIPPPPNITVVGDTLFSSHASGYQWYYNGNPIANATDSFYVWHQGGTYSVQITDGNGCYSLSQGMMVAVNELASGSPQLVIYPNPARDQFTIYGLTPGPSPRERGASATIEIYNVFGEKVYSRQLESGNSKPETVNCKQFAAGIYFVKVANEEMNWIGKFVKE